MGQQKDYVKIDSFFVVVGYNDVLVGIDNEMELLEAL